MASHKLSLEIPDTLNTCVMRIVDLSVYNEDLTVTCPRLRISSPGFSQSYFVDDLDKNFARNFTACDLKIQTEDCGDELNDLPDRIYVITWSVPPHDKVYVEYNHMRITKALVMIRERLCDLDLGACEPSEKQHEKLRKLDDLRMMFIAAKSMAEVCHDASAALKIYNYAMEELKKLDCKNCK